MINLDQMKSKKLTEESNYGDEHQIDIQKLHVRYSSIDLLNSISQI